MELSATFSKCKKACINIFILHYVDQSYTTENESTKEK